MKLLFLLHDYLPEHVGGVEVHAHRLARELARRGHEVTALFGERDLARAEGELREGELDGVRLLERVHQREYAALEDTWREPGALAAFESLLLRERFDLVHVHHLAGWGPACIAAARRARLPVVFTAHDFHPLCDDARLFRPDGSACREPARCVECLRRHPAPAAGAADAETALARAATERRAAFRAALGLVDLWVAPSRTVALEIERAGAPAGRVEVLAPGALGPRAGVEVSDAREARLGERGRPRFGFLGGLYPAKGAHLALEALGRLAARDMAAELELWGVLGWFPDYVARLRSQAAGLPAGAAVRFAGRFAPDGVDDVLDRLDALVVPSLWRENAPLVVQDAFRRRLPVVVADHGGLAEAVLPGRGGRGGRGGLRFRAGDAGALAGALERLGREPALRRELARTAPRPLAVGELARRLEVRYAALAGTALAVGSPQ